MIIPSLFIFEAITPESDLKEIETYNCNTRNGL